MPAKCVSNGGMVIRKNQRITIFIWHVFVSIGFVSLIQSFLYIIQCLMVGPLYLFNRNRLSVYVQCVYASCAFQSVICIHIQIVEMISPLDLHVRYNFSFVWFFWFCIENVRILQGFRIPGLIFPLFLVWIYC